MNYISEIANNLNKLNGAKYMIIFMLVLWCNTLGHTLFYTNLNMISEGIHSFEGFEETRKY